MDSPTQRTTSTSPSRGKPVNIDGIPTDTKARKSGLTTRYRGSRNISFDKLPSIDDANPKEIANLLLLKLHQCCTICDFTEPNSNEREKDYKRKTLLELITYVSQVNADSLDESFYKESAHMLECNLFKASSGPSSSATPSLSIPSNVYGLDFLENEEPLLDPAWVHLELIYQYLLKFIEIPQLNMDIAKKYFDLDFAEQLIGLFDSQDPRERDYLKTILHRFYGKFLALRPHIRRIIAQVCYEVTYEDSCKQGIAELLEILGSIINGFALPIKSEHRHFLFNVLIPLHKVPYLAMFHPQLAYCCIQYIQKDASLAYEIVGQLLRLWPRTNSGKQVLLLGEIEEILENVNDHEFKMFCVPLFKLVARSVESSHFQVAERALQYWSNPYLLGMIKEQIPLLLPILFPSLYRNSKAHWHRNIHGLIYNVMKVFLEADGRLFDECTKYYRDNKIAEKFKERDRLQKWSDIEQLAAAKITVEASLDDIVQHIMTVACEEEQEGELSGFGNAERTTNLETLQNDDVDRVDIDEKNGEQTAMPSTTTPKLNLPELDLSVSSITLSPVIESPSTLNAVRFDFSPSMISANVRLAEKEKKEEPDADETE